MSEYTELINKHKELVERYKNLISKNKTIDIKLDKEKVMSIEEISVLKN